MPLATLVTVPPKLGEVFVIVTVPPSATVPPPDNPEPAVTVIELFASIAFDTPADGMLIVPLPVIGPPVKPAPVATLVTPVLLRVTVPPNATVPPPDNPDPAVTVTELFASMAFVTPAEGMLIVPLAVIGPPVRPAPVATLVTVPEPVAIVQLAPNVHVCPFTVVNGLTSIAFVTPAEGMLIVPVPVIGPPVKPAPVATLVTVPPPVPGNVCPVANVINPVLAIDSPVSAGAVPFEPNSRFNVPDGLAVSFPEGSACQRKSCVTAAAVLLLYDDVCKSNGFEM